MEESSSAEVAAEKPSQDARVARKETTDEATDVSLEHWGRGAELVGDQVTRLGGCQVGQFNCLGQAPEWDTADSSCEVCYNHYDSCLKKRLVMWCQGEMKGYDDMWCLGEVCQYDTDTGDEVGFNSNREELAIPTVTACRKELEAVQEDIHPELCQNDTDNGDSYNARNEAADDVCQDMGKSSNERVARKETTDEATDVGLEHWGRGAELIGDQVTGLEKHVEATDVVEESSGAKSSCEKVPGVESPDEVLEGG